MDTEHRFSRGGRTASSTTVLTSVSALFGGLQFAILSPLLAVLLVEIYGAEPVQVGWIIMVFNASGFLSALLIPLWADRMANYRLPLLFCTVLNSAFAFTFATSTTLTGAVMALVIFGGPGGVGLTVLFAQMKNSDTGRDRIIRVRAYVALAWVIGPPLATLVIQTLLMIAAAINTVVAAVFFIATRTDNTGRPDASEVVASERRLSRRGIGGVVVALTSLHAANSASVAMIGLLVAETMGLSFAWAGAALAISAALEIPSFYVIAALSTRLSTSAILSGGCVCGIIYYVAMSSVSSAAVLIAVQPLNALCVATVGAIGLTVLQDIIPRPGLASGLSTNTRRVGSIAAGVLIAAASIASSAYVTVFVICAVVTALSLVLAAASLRASPEVSQK